MTVHCLGVAVAFMGPQSAASNALPPLIGLQLAP